LKARSIVAKQKGRRAPLFLKGSPADGHATADKLQVQDWRGSEWLTLTHRDGRVLTLHKCAEESVRLEGGPWNLADITWTMGRDSDGAISEPVVGVEHHCSGQGGPPA
jgi:hypothetical protein